MRKPLIAGNWKMNKTIAEAVELTESLLPGAASATAETAICVPFTALQEVGRVLEGSSLALGAQNMHEEESGAYTGEISPLMLNELKVTYVILGHSERRMYFAETDRTVNGKIRSALRHGLRPIVCVGESLEIREAGTQKDWVKDQILQGFEGISGDMLERITIAYEPIWAIGTGRTASSAQAEEMCGFIRDLMGRMYGENAACGVRILYGGSVKPDNIGELMGMDNIDGALVGGASLSAADFTALMNVGAE